MKRNYSNHFKFKVILEVLQGNSTITETMSKYQISKSVIHKWKKQFLERGSTVFSSSNQNNEQQKEINIEKLHATIGKLKVENDFLQAAWQRIKD